MIKVTKHYGFGLLVGTGFGLFLGSMLAESGLMGPDSGSRRWIGLIGILAIIAGGLLYSLDLKKSTRAT